VIQKSEADFGLHFIKSSKIIDIWTDFYKLFENVQYVPVS